jgi:putative Ca2+/H+ antiporter (TMEM165/GDT1 family)
MVAAIKEITMPQRKVGVGPAWTLLNTTAALEVVFQNLGTKRLEVTLHSSSTVAPLTSAPFTRFLPELGDRGDLATVFKGATGSFVWGRSEEGTEAFMGWI